MTFKKIYRYGRHKEEGGLAIFLNIGGDKNVENRIKISWLKAKDKENAVNCISWYTRTFCL